MASYVLNPYVFPSGQSSMSSFDKFGVNHLKKLTKYRLCARIQTKEHSSYANILTSSDL